MHWTGSTSQIGEDIREMLKYAKLSGKSGEANSLLKQLGLAYAEGTIPSYSKGRSMGLAYANGGAVDENG